jgi:hypothetical protein
MWTTILTVGLQLLGWILGNNAENKQMQELFYKFVERIQSMYLKSAHAQADAKDIWKKMDERLMMGGFQESP